MEFNHLIDIVKIAISNCEAKIQHTPNLVLSEGDLERLLSNEISCLLEMPLNDEGYVVHNQVSHYKEGQSNRDYQVDIVIMKRGFQESKILNKGYKYDDDSIAIELKYFKNYPEKDELNYDLQKSDSLLKERSKCAFFSVVLLEDNAYRDVVEGCFDNYRDNPLIHTFVITKQSTNQNQ